MTITGFVQSAGIIRSGVSVVNKTLKLLMSLSRLRITGSKSSGDVTKSYISTVSPTSDISMYDLRSLMDQASGKKGGLDVAGGGIEGRIVVSLKARNLIAAWIKYYVQRGDFNGFKTKWKWARTTIDLQTRILVEQVLFDFGNPWRSLVSGFSPI